MEEIKTHQRHRALAQLFEMQDADFPPGSALESALDAVITQGEMHERYCSPTTLIELIMHDFTRDALDMATLVLIDETSKRYKEFKQSSKIK